MRPVQEEEGWGRRGSASDRLHPRLPTLGTLGHWAPWDTGHPSRGLARPPKFLLAFPRRQLLTLLQGDEHAARQPALLKQSGQLRQELEHKPGPVRQSQILAPSSPNPSHSRRQRSPAKPQISVPQPARSGFTCSLSRSTIPASLAPRRQHKAQAIGAGSSAHTGRDFRY